MSETKEDQKGRILPRKDFHLTSVKMTSKKDGLIIKHHLGGPNPQTQTNECEYRPHPDLLNSFNELRL